MTSVRFLMLLCVLTAAPAFSGVVARLEAPDINEIRMTGFELDRKSEVRVEAVGIRSESATESFFSRLFERGSDDDAPPRMSVYAWILNADTRKPVWVMKAGDTSGLSGSLAVAEPTLELESGRYELYLSSQHSRMRFDTDDEEREVRSFWDLFGGDRRGAAELREELAQCHATLRIDGLSEDSIRRFEPSGAFDDAIVTVNRLGNSSLEVRGIEVGSPTEINLYGIFEFVDGDDYPSDFAWIVDESSREVVWIAARTNSKAAGGSSKNRVVDTELTLQSGRYLLYVGSDDSHAFGSFNAPPPYDPLNWGMTIRAGAKSGAGSIRVFEPRPTAPAAIDFSKAGDNEELRQAFRLKRDGNLHIRALGEYSDGKFYDGAWIVESATGKRVWQMAHRTTMGAGGARKNRMFDGLVALPQGEYFLHYSSDGSHAYGSWNSATPFEPEAWGVVLRPGPGMNPGDIEPI